MVVSDVAVVLLWFSGVALCFVRIKRDLAPATLTLPALWSSALGAGLELVGRPRPTGLEINENKEEAL